MKNTFEPEVKCKNLNYENAIKYYFNRILYFFIGAAKGFNTPRPCLEIKIQFRINASWACPLGSLLAFAKSLLGQVLENQHEKAIVVVGAGHLLGIKKGFEIQFPNICIKIIDEE